MDVETNCQSPDIAQKRNCKGFVSQRQRPRAPRACQRGHSASGYLQAYQCFRRPCQHHQELSNFEADQSAQDFRRYKLQKCCQMAPIAFWQEAQRSLPISSYVSVHRRLIWPGLVGSLACLEIRLPAQKHKENTTPRI